MANIHQERGPMVPRPSSSGDFRNNLTTPGPEKGLPTQLDTSKDLTFLLYSIIVCFIGPNSP